MLNEELYEQLELEFEKNRIEDAVEDILLEMAEALADHGVVGKELTYRDQAGLAKLSVVGVCEDDESVFIKTLTINGKEYEIEDYLL